MRYKERKYTEWTRSRSDSDADFRDFIRKGLIVNIKDGRIWKERYLKKADHNLDFAVFVTDLHVKLIKERFPGRTFYDWVATAYYYAIYHSALALLADIGFKSRSHLATLCGIINYYYHRTKSLERKHIEILGKVERKNIEQFLESQNLRQRASYGVSLNFEERLAKIARDDAVEFANKVKEILGKT